MTRSWKTFLASSVATVLVIGSGIGSNSPVRAKGVSAAATTTATSTPAATAARTPVATTTGSPKATVVHTRGETATRTPVETAVRTAAAAKGTPTKVGAVATPKAAPTQKSGLPAAVALESGLKPLGNGLDPKKALQMANALVPSLYVIAPKYVPAAYILQLIHVDPAQDQQTPASAYLMYVPKNLKTVKGLYPSFYVNMKVGLSTVIFPGVKPQIVTINPGKKGVGIVKGSVVDFKPKKGNEVIHVLWTRVTTSYDISSNVSQSKLTIKDLVAVAASM